MNQIINVNVGGCLYTTTLHTLLQKDSRLARMFDGSEPCPKDSQGNYFIDRDGTIFRYVLNFLRTSRLNLPDGFQDFGQLAEEAEFYGVPTLLQAVEERRRESTPKTKPSILRMIRNDDHEVVWLTGGAETLKEVVPERCSFDDETAASFSSGGANIEGGEVILSLPRNKLGAFLQHIISKNFDVKSIFLERNRSEVWVFTRK